MVIYRYRVRDWDLHFETAQSRKVDRPQWIGVPNKQHGMGLAKILSQEDGAAIFGIWYLIIGSCSHQRTPRLGWLTHDGTASGLPWSAQDMADKWHRPLSEISRALDVLCSPKVNWIETIEEVGDDSQLSPGDRSLSSRVEASPVQAGRDGADAPAPVASQLRQRQDNRMQLRALVARNRYASDDRALEEWIGLLEDEAKCRTLSECADCLRFLKVRQKRVGMDPRVSRFAAAHEQGAVDWKMTQVRKRETTLTIVEKSA